MDPEQNGMMLSYIGAISLFMQGIGISTLTKRADDKVLMTLSTSTLMVSYFVMVSFFSSHLKYGVIFQGKESSSQNDTNVICSYTHQYTACKISAQKLQQ